MQKTKKGAQHTSENVTEPTDNNLIQNERLPIMNEKTHSINISKIWRVELPT